MAARLVAAACCIGVCGTSAAGQRPPGLCPPVVRIELLPPPEAARARPIDTTAYFDCAVDQPAALHPRRFPRYPRLLATAGVGGVVSVEMTISPSGTIDSTRVVVLRSTHELFALAVRASLTTWHATPARLRGQPVPESVRVDFRFDPDCASPPRMLARSPASREPRQVEVCAGN